MRAIDSCPIIIGGFYRTGSSLLRRLLDSHSEIHCASEIKFFDDLYDDYPNDPLRHLRFFRTIRALGLSENQLLNIWGKAFVDSHELAANKHGKKRWADKNPKNVLFLKQWEYLLPNGFLFVQTTRNPFDALASLKEIGFSKTTPDSFIGKVELMKKFIDAGSSYVLNNPENSISIRYEDLVSRPLEVLDGLFKFIGVNFESSVVNKFMSDERGGGVEDPKLKSNNNNAIYTDSINRWRSDLSSDEVDAVSEIILDS